MRKYFKFTTLCNHWKPFLFVMIMNIVGQCYDGWSISDMIKIDIILVAVGIFGTLISDWLQIKNNNSKDENSEE